MDWNRIHTLSRPYSNDFIGQLENKFAEHYSDSGWNASTTLFSMFFGINDVHQTYRSKDAPAAIAGIFEGYKGLVDEVTHTIICPSIQCADAVPSYIAWEGEYSCS